MKRPIYVLVLAICLIALTGCAKGSGGSTATGGGAVTSRDAGPWKAITPGPNETKRIANLSKDIKLWESTERASGRKPADLSAITPALVGYRVQIWSKGANGTFTLATLVVTDGSVVQVGTSTPLKPGNVVLLEGQPEHLTQGITPASAGEKDAIAKAIAWAQKAFPSHAWKADIQGYELYYALPGGASLIFIPNAATTGYMAINGSPAKK